jgi:hypothetical protein
MIPEAHMTRANARELTEKRSLALHQEVARRIRQDPTLVVRAQRRVEQWLHDGSTHPYYARAWQQVLASGVDAICRTLIDPSEHAASLRQASPFAGVIDPKTRWAILRNPELRHDPDAA